MNGGGQDLLTPQDGVPAVLLSLPIVPNNQKTKTRFPNLGELLQRYSKKWLLQMADYITRRAISKWVFAKQYSNGFGSGSCTEFVKKVGWGIMQ
jgi:hypothetical protein